MVQVDALFIHLHLKNLSRNWTNSLGCVSAWVGVLAGFYNGSRPRPYRWVCVWGGQHILHTEILN